MEKRCKKYTVVIEKDKETGTYVGEVPGLPACHSHGRTIAELMKNMEEAITLCREVEGDLAEAPSEFVGVRQIEVSA